MDFEHYLADRTAVILSEFSENIMKISSMENSSKIMIKLEYDDAPAETRITEVKAIFEKNDDGEYLINDVKIGDLKKTIEIYTFMCATLIKSIGYDEKIEDKRELFLKDREEWAGIEKKDDDNKEDIVIHFSNEDDEEEPEIYEVFAATTS
jgi:hypothetical protein